MRDGEIVSDEINRTPTAYRKPRVLQQRSHPHRAEQRSPGLRSTPHRFQPKAMSGRLLRPRRAGLCAMILAAAAQAIGATSCARLLTMLGVFIGVAALIAMVAVGQGANEAVEKQIESLGTNLLVVLPGATTASGARAGLGSASRSPPTTRSRSGARIPPSQTWAI